MRSRRRSWLMAPIHVAALATGAKSFRDNPIIGSPTLNRAGLHVARMRLAYHMAERRRERLAPLISNEDRAAFSRDGFVIKRDFLPSAAFDALKQQVLSFAAPARQQSQGDAITRRIALDRRAMMRLPTVRALVESPEWLSLVRYIGSYRLEPFLYVQTIFAHAREAAPDPQTRLHADTFHPTVKAWFFLTDVGEGQGPLIFVRRLSPADAAAPGLGAARFIDRWGKRRFSIVSRLAANQRANASAPGVRSAQSVRRTAEYACGCRHDGVSRARHLDASGCPQRDLGLRPPQSILAVAGAGRVRSAHGKGPCRTALLVGDGPL